LETAAKLLISLEAIFGIFSKCTLKSLDNQTDFDSAIPWFESRRPSQTRSLIDRALFCRDVCSSGVILNAFLLLVLNVCSRGVRQTVRMPLPGGGQSPFHRPRGVALIGLLALVSGQCPTVAVGQRGFLQFAERPISRRSES
jgi:hypothetical protein